MKNFNLVLCIFFALGLMGCTKIMKTMYGIKDPEFETTASIEKFVIEAFGEQIPFVVLKHTEWKEGRSISTPDLFVFNNQGKYIPYKDSLRPNCNGPAEVFLAELSSEKIYHYGDDYSLNSFLNKFDGPNCDANIIVGSDKVDFYIFISFAKFVGKRLIREKSLEWIKALKGNKNITYKLILLDQDFQDCWSDQQKKEFEGSSEKK